jgi:cyclopropane-fatty-acyl-phospholipid synthase
MNNLAPFFKALEEIKYGNIEIELPNGEIKKFSSSNNCVSANFKIKNLEVADECLINGDIGLGETYIKNMWESNNLADFILFLALNSEALERFFHAHKIKMFLLYLQAKFRKNTHKGSQKNIKFHYDLGNDFYKLWLDESMTYSSAIFNNNDLDLKTAQKNKYERILSKLSDKKTILEIGCGWGGFALEAVTKGYQVTGLTLSKEQEKYANNLGLGHNFKVKLQDYRLEKEKYDNIVSIEMFEAVGRQYWDTYFKTIKNCLNKEGKAIIQTITIDDEVAKSYKNRVDFIQKYIFPGGVLPSKSEFIKLAKANDLEVISAFDFGKDYQKTLLKWLDNFNKVQNEVKKLGFNEEFIRKWQFYLTYCAAGFGAKRTSVVQFELIKK